MAVTNTPIFIQAPRAAAASIATANTNRDGTGTIGTVFTAGANGSKIDHIDICAAGTTTAGVVRLYLYDGSTYYLWKEILIAAITPSATIAAAMVALDCSVPGNSLYLASGWSLRASTHNAETFKVIAMGGDY